MKRARQRVVEWLLKQPMWFTLAIMWLIAAGLLALTLDLELLILRLMGQT